MALFHILAVFVFLIVATLWKRLTRREKIPKGLKKLPGPKGLPIIGSVAEIPDELSWMKFAEWGKEYGPIYQCNLAGSNHVWISSDQIAHDLLSKKGAIYSDRPHIPALIDDNRDSGQYLPLMSKNALWTRQRKFANHIMRQHEKTEFNHYPELESIRLLTELIHEPSQYNHALESFIARVTSRLAWGHSEASDELKQRARELLIGVSPNGALGNKLAFLMGLPDWLSPAKAWERRRHNTEKRFFEIMQSDVRREMSEKRAPMSWTSLFLESAGAFNFSGDTEGAYAVGMHGIAGALTIAAPMQVFCLAMCHHPQYLEKLHEEIDRVCGDRMPTLSDKPQLPFLRAIIREVIRWRPPVPTGIPHYLTQDDEYNGFHIPAGSIMHPLEWSISRDPTMFPDPETFNPMRWLEPSFPTYKEPLTQYPTILNSSQFGYGRRTCQGQTVTEADLLVGIGSMAWLFSMRREQDYSDSPARPSSPTSPMSVSSFDSAPSPLETEKVESRRLWPNEKASISVEELNAGLSVHSDDTNSPSDAPDAVNAPGAFPRQTENDLKAEYLARLEKRRKEQEKLDKEDPTLAFTKLLIAKPKPFKFEMVVRDQSRAARVLEMYGEKTRAGEFKDARQYWGEEQGKGKELGWGVV
ncbi:cytochrome P450 [Aulographum hederae CBS 113979]|uniref:Cytochrome P450 n=1 Tax=Aulographum hederae CBS 113979 TaxID=1176131 RepID=A0A6G1HG25_9PEZI|nr:cytochrome P450 [Aulographum hederae CBS 113979]